MKKLLLLAAVALFATSVFTLQLVNAAPAPKVTICHVPPGNPANAHEITISANALQAHLGDNEQGLHGGDYYGPCGEPEPVCEITECTGLNYELVDPQSPGCYCACSLVDEIDCGLDERLVDDGTDCLCIAETGS